MPFTLSHPAAVLPFRKWCPERLDMPALIAGSMLPDFGYFFCAFQFSAFLHKPLGSVLVIPLGLVALFCWRFVQEPIAELLPSPHREFWRSVGVRKFVGKELFAAKKLFVVKELWVLSVSLFIGAWTHILWDSFTHAHGFFVDLVPQLFKYSFTVGGGKWYVFKCLQYGFSVVGLFFLSRAYLGSLATVSSANAAWREPHKWRKIAMLACIPCGGFLLASALASYQYSQVGFGLDRLGFLLIVYTIAFSLALLVLIALVKSCSKKR
jgi:hypothetical protein